MLYVKYGKIGFMASEEMTFENVEDWRHRQMDDGCLAIL